MARITSRWLLRGGIAELGLTKVESLVVIALLDHIDKAGVAWCPQRRMERQISVSRQAINAAEARMREMGVLIEHEPGRPGRATRYRFGDTRTVQPVASVDRLEGSNLSTERGQSNVVDLSPYLARG